MKQIVSRDNAQFRRFRRLAHSAKDRRGDGLMLLDGVHLIDAYVSVYGADALRLVARASSIDRVEVAERLAAAPDVVVLSDALFDEISPVETPTGLLAVAPIPRPVPAVGTGHDRFTLLLDGLQDPGNLGAVLRSAAAAGGREVFLSDQCADPWSPRCLRAGMGAHFHLAIHDREDLLKAAQGFPGRVLAADSRGERSLFEVDLAGEIAFVIGGEGAGISPALFALASERVRIPMATGIESLNAAAAATLLFYEWRRQRPPSEGWEMGRARGGSSRPGGGA